MNKSELVSAIAKESKLTSVNIHGNNCDCTVDNTIIIDVTEDSYHLEIPKDYVEKKGIIVFGKLKNAPEQLKKEINDKLKSAGNDNTQADNAVADAIFFG